MKKIYILTFLLLLPWWGWGQDDTVKLGVALSGGAAKGYAHLGVLQALDEANIQVDVISGTSMGAIVGLFYAAGYTPKEIMQMAKDEKMDGFNKVMNGNGRKHRYRRLRHIIYKHIPSNCFDSLQIPFYCCATDINNVRPVYVGHGLLLAQYVTASASMPMVFKPIVINDITYVDGGVLDNLPVKPLIDEGCNIRIGSYIRNDRPTPNLKKKDIAYRTASIILDANLYDRLPLCTHIAEIDRRNLSLWDFDRIDEFFNYGYEAGKKLLQDHPELLLHQRKTPPAPIEIKPN